VVDRSADVKGRVLRGGGDGLAFSVAPGQAFKLRPRPIPPGKGRRGVVIPTEACAIQTNLEPRAGLFKELLPTPPNTQVLLQSVSGDAEPISESYTPGDEDMFVFRVTLPAKEGMADPHERVKQQVEALANDYKLQSAARAKSNNRTIASGLWTIKVKLP